MYLLVMQGSEGVGGAGDEVEEGGEGKKRKRPTRDRQQEALDSGKIKAAHVKPSKLVASPTEPTWLTYIFTFIARRTPL
jgi:hypothetical protein